MMLTKGVSMEKSEKEYKKLQKNHPMSPRISNAYVTKADEGLSIAVNGNKPYAFTKPLPIF